MATATQEYLKTQVMTASPEMLTLMLWDGAIRFAEQGKEAIVRKDVEGSFKALLRAQKIVMELTNTLKPEVNPELVSNLSALYNFIYRRLVEANIKKDAKLVDDALEIMRHQRETWVLLMDKLTQERAGQAQATVSANADAVATSENFPVAATPAGPTKKAIVRPSLPGIAIPPKPKQHVPLSIQG